MMRAIFVVLALARRARGLFQGLVNIPPEELGRWCRVDIGRRRSELVAVGWLGRAYRVAPQIFDAALPDMFRFAAYDDGRKWLRRGDGTVACAVRFGETVVPRGVPLSLRLGTVGGRVASVSVEAVGPDLIPDDVGSEAIADADAERLCASLNGAARRLVVDAVCAAVFDSLEPALARASAPVAVGPPRAFTPRRDLYAREGSSEKWLQRVSDYYFADAQLQEVSLGGDGGVRFWFYLDEAEPLNSADPTRNVNPEVLCCKFAQPT